MSVAVLERLSVPNVAMDPEDLLPPDPKPNAVIRDITRRQADTRVDPLMFRGYSMVTFMSHSDANDDISEKDDFLSNRLPLWATNFQWVPDQRHRDISEARSMTVVSSIGHEVQYDDRFPPAYMGESIYQTVRRRNHWNLEDVWASKWVQVGLEKNEPRRWMPRAVARGRDTKVKSICINTKKYYRAITVDIDNTSPEDTVLERVSRLKHLPLPSMVVEDRKKGTAHVTFILKTPVFRTPKAVRYRDQLQRIRKLLTKALGGDPHYTNYWTKNPFHKDNIAHWFTRNNVYSLDDLEMGALMELGLSAEEAGKALESSFGTEPKSTEKRPKVRHSGTGRNSMIFDLLRKKCYPMVRYFDTFDDWHKLVSNWAVDLNEKVARDHFPDRGPLSANEVQRLVKSVAEWVWNCIDRRFSGKAHLGAIRSKKTYRQALAEAREIHPFCDGESRTKRILLPVNMTKKEFVSLWMKKSGGKRNKFPEYIRKRMEERITDPSKIKSAREREKKTTRIQPRELDLRQQRRLIHQVFRSPRDWGVTRMAQEYNVDSQGLWNFINAYLNQPWTFFGLSARQKGLSPEIRDWARAQAQANWKMAAHNGGLLTDPFRHFATPPRDVGEFVQVQEVRTKFMKMVRCAHHNGHHTGVRWSRVLRQLEFTDNDLDPRDLKEPWRVQGPP